MVIHLHFRYPRISEIYLEFLRNLFLWTVRDGTKIEKVNLAPDTKLQIKEDC